MVTQEKHQEELIRCEAQNLGHECFKVIVITTTKCMYTRMISYLYVYVFNMSCYTLSMRYTDIHILYIAVLDILNYMLLQSLENVEYHVRRV